MNIEQIGVIAIGIVAALIIGVWYFVMRKRVNSTDWYNTDNKE